jgi:hypothetical protein
MLEGLTVKGIEDVTHGFHVPMFSTSPRLLDTRFGLDTVIEFVLGANNAVVLKVGYDAESLAARLGREERFWWPCTVTFFKFGPK